MTLRLYRRHGRDCEARIPSDTCTGEFEESRKGVKRCGCPIAARGTLTGRYGRKSTGAFRWDDAKSIVAAWKSWSEEPPAPPPVAAAPEHRAGITEVTEAWLAGHINRGVSRPTLSKYRTFCKLFSTYADLRGYVCLDQWTFADSDRFYASWKDAKHSKAKKLERFKAFSKFCVKRKFLAMDMAEDLMAPVGSSIPVHKSPFTDEEIERFYKACGKVAEQPQGPGFRNWCGEDVRDFFDLAIYTGMRISDLATLDISQRLQGNEITLRQHKTGKPLLTYIPDWLVERLQTRRQRFGDLVFKSELASTVTMRNMAEIWRKRMAYVFEQAGIFTERPTPHRCRHTFIRILLERGVPVADVAELAGDTEATIRRFYSKWIESRQARLSLILKSAFEDRPRVGTAVAKS
jgi:integrase